MLMCIGVCLLYAGVDKLKATIIVLEKLDPETVPLILNCQKSDSSSAAAIEQLRLIKRRWNSEVKFLLSVIDEISDCVIISEVTGTKDVINTIDVIAILGMIYILIKYCKY